MIEAWPGFAPAISMIEAWPGFAPAIAMIEAWPGLVPAIAMTEARRVPNRNVPAGRATPVEIAATSPWDKPGDDGSYRLLWVKFS
jgi:hypothetical protein